VSYELAHGTIQSGMYVCHTCDVRHCVNPQHLFLGTQKDNMRDAAVKGRLVMPRVRVSGEQHGAAKLTFAQVVEIRAQTGACTCTELARIYGVNRVQISRIQRGLSWREAQ
jgi:hypothetical protein